MVDAVRLLQSDLLPEMDAVWVVQCAPEVQWSRLTQNRSMAPQAAKARLRAQPAFEHPAVAAVIENSGSRGDLEQQVRFLWQALSSERTGSND